MQESNPHEDVWSLVVAATTGKVSSDVEANMMVVRAINARPQSTISPCIAALSRQLHDKNQLHRVLTLLLLEVCMDNCDEDFHFYVGKCLLSRIYALALKKRRLKFKLFKHQRIYERFKDDVVATAIRLICKWGQRFYHTERLAMFPRLYSSTCYRGLVSHSGTYNGTSDLFSPVSQSTTTTVTNVQQTHHRVSSSDTRPSSRYQNTASVPFQPPASCRKKPIPMYTITIPELPGQEEAQEVKTCCELSTAISMLLNLISDAFGAQHTESAPADTSNIEELLSQLRVYDVEVQEAITRCTQENELAELICIHEKAALVLSRGTKGDIASQTQDSTTEVPSRGSNDAPPLLSSSRRLLAQSGAAGSSSLFSTSGQRSSTSDMQSDSRATLPSGLPFFSPELVSPPAFPTSHSDGYRAPGLGLASNPGYSARPPLPPSAPPTLSEPSLPSQTRPLSISASFITQPPAAHHPPAAHPAQQLPASNTASPHTHSALSSFDSSSTTASAAQVDLTDVSTEDSSLALSPTSTSPVLFSTPPSSVSSLTPSAAAERPQSSNCPTQLSASSFTSLSSTSDLISFPPPTNLLNSPPPATISHSASVPSSSSAHVSSPKACAAGFVSDGVKYTAPTWIQKLPSDRRGKLCYLASHSDGVLYEDDKFQVGVVYDMPQKNTKLKICVYFGNLTTADCSTLSVSVRLSRDSGLSIKASTAPSRVRAEQQVEFQIYVLCTAPFNGPPPTLKLQFRNQGEDHEILLHLPVFVFQFMTPSIRMRPTMFDANWKVLQGGQQSRLPNVLPADCDALMTRCNMFCVNKTNSEKCYCGVFLSENLTVPVFVRLSGELGRTSVAVRCEHDTVCTAVFSLLVAVLSP